MPHETSLIATIAMGLVLAFALGFVASKLRLPPLVGYLVAGIIVGPYTPGFVADAELAGQLAEIGVILLMFGVGLHFSISDLLAVRRIAIPGAIVQILTATVIGGAIALAWGWTLGAALVFGLSLSVASTVVLLRALEERRALDTISGRIAVGWLIVEDLAMVLALVLLPAVAGALGGDSRGLAGSLGSDNLALTILFTLGKVALFVAIVVVIGRRVVPWLLGRVARVGSRELFTLAVLAFALGIAFGSAELFGVSFALGAFFAGVVLNESDLSHKAAADTLPLQDAFAVLFFVSVGMLFDPSIIIREPLAILAVLFVILLGKSLAAFAIVLLLGHPIRTALVISASLAQIGEFSFILAGLGMTLGLLPQEGSDLILAGALLSITLNPLVFGAIGPLARWFDHRPTFKARLERVTADGLAVKPEGSGDHRGHAVLVGSGRVGSKIERALRAWDLPVVVVESDRHLAESLRARGIEVIYGDASAPGILAAAEIDQARVLIIASSDPNQSHRMIEIARAANPDIEIVVRAYSDADLASLEEMKVSLAVLSYTEVALGMMGYALRAMGLSEGEARMFVQSSRRFDDAGVATSAGDMTAAPELRHHERHPNEPDRAKAETAETDKAS